MVQVQSYRLSLALVPPLPLCAGVVAVREGSPGVHLSPCRPADGAV